VETQKYRSASSQMDDLDREHLLAVAQDDVPRVGTLDGTFSQGVTNVSLREDDHAKLTRAFAAFDADGDGKLTEAEVIGALTRKTGWGTELSEENARATWRRWKFEFDLNDDGKISTEELARAKPADQAQDELIEAGMTDWEMHEANDEI
jgi:Ca2+-binding EF-hand superfamily protein